MTDAVKYVGPKNDRRNIMFYLYKKTHLITGLNYLGQTNKDPFRYKGSGLYWKLHLKKHGNLVSTEILKECETKEDLRKWGEYYSNLWNIVESDHWANFKPEIGDGGSKKGTNQGRRHSSATKEKISGSKKGRPAPWASKPRSTMQKSRLRDINLGKKLSTTTVEKMISSKKANGTLRHTEETRLKMQKPKTAEARKNMKDSRQLRAKTEGKRIWITDGIENRTILEHDIVPIGWKIGRTIDTTPPSQRGKIWVNNGIENKMIATMPELGWTPGRIKKGKKND